MLGIEGLSVAGASTVLVLDTVTGIGSVPDEQALKPSSHATDRRTTVLDQFRSPSLVDADRQG
ncbi:MAG: hypothetical protein ACRDS0_27125 [Pseudonocardiaceae bacterium]